MYTLYEYSVVRCVVVYYNIAIIENVHNIIRNGVGITGLDNLRR